MLVGMTEGDLAEQQEELALCEAMIAEMEEIGGGGQERFDSASTSARSKARRLIARTFHRKGSALVISMPRYIPSSTSK